MLHTVDVPVNKYTLCIFLYFCLLPHNSSVKARCPSSSFQAAGFDISESFVRLIIKTLSFSICSIEDKEKILIVRMCGLRYCQEFFVADFVVVVADEFDFAFGGGVKVEVGEVTFWEEKSE